MIEERPLSVWLVLGYVIAITRHLRIAKSLIGKAVKGRESALFLITEKLPLQESGEPGKWLNDLILGNSLSQLRFLLTFFLVYSDFWLEFFLYSSVILVPWAGKTPKEVTGYGIDFFEDALPWSSSFREGLSHSCQRASIGIGWISLALFFSSFSLPLSLSLFIGIKSSARSFVRSCEKGSYPFFLVFFFSFMSTPAFANDGGSGSKTSPRNRFWKVLGWKQCL